MSMHKTDDDSTLFACFKSWKIELLSSYYGVVTFMCCDLYQDIIEYVFADLLLKLSSTLIVVLQEFPFAKSGTFEHGVNGDHILKLQAEANATNFKNVKTS